MRLDISYCEAEKFVESRYGKRVRLKALSTDTLSVGVEVKVLFVRKEVAAKVKVERVTGECVALSYTGGDVVDTLLKGIVASLNDKIEKYAWLEIDPSAKLVTVRLDKIDSLKRTLQYLKPESISFGDTKATVEAALNPQA